MGRVFDRYGLAWLWGKVKSYTKFTGIETFKFFVYTCTFFVLPIEEINTSLTDCGSISLSLLTG